MAQPAQVARRTRRATPVTGTAAGAGRTTMLLAWRPWLGTMGLTYRISNHGFWKHTHWTLDLSFRLKLNQ